MYIGVAVVDMCFVVVVDVVGVIVCIVDAGWKVSVAVAVVVLFALLLPMLPFCVVVVCLFWFCLCCVCC